ncbi:MAG: glycosyltransferase family 9 protein [Ginsengibacter sp.]
MKFLIIRFSSIGDIVLASPVMRCLKKQVPSSEIHFLTKLSFKMVTASNPYIDKFFYYDTELDKVIDELQKENFDYVIDLHNNFRSNKVKRSLKKKSFTIDKLTIEKFFLTKLHLNFMPGKHITKRSLETVKSFGVKDDGLGLDYFIPDTDRVPEKDLPFSHLAGYIAIVIGASYKTKKLPVHKLKELCSKIRFPVILIGGKQDFEEGKMVSGTDPIKIYNACGKFNLNQSADLARRSMLVISNDTGLQYIASAFKKPTLAIWGSTSPKLDVEPFYGDEFVKKYKHKIYENIIVPGLWCQPCSKYGRKKCPLGHFNCMEKQDVDLIVKKVEELLL